MTHFQIEQQYTKLLKITNAGFDDPWPFATMQPQQAKDHSHIFGSHGACGSQIERSNNSKQIENQICSVTKKPVRFLRLQGLARDWSKHNEHSRNIFSVHGFLTLGVMSIDERLPSHIEIHGTVTGVERKPCAQLALSDLSFLFLA